LDALHWKPKTLLQIAEESGKYLVGLKENQKQLLLKQVCKTSEKQAILQQFSGVEKGHGRIETRSYEFYDLPEMEKDERREDCKIRTAIKVKRVRNDIKTGKKSQETSYYVSNEVGNYEEISSAIRGQWQLEQKGTSREFRR